MELIYAFMIYVFINAVFISSIVTISVLYNLKRGTLFGKPRPFKEELKDVFLSFPIAILFLLLGTPLIVIAFTLDQLKKQEAGA